ncbi:trans-homoaconitate synthase [compost metagenome]
MIGKHSGRAALAHVLGQQGVDYDEKRLNELLDHVRTLSITKSGEVLAEELVTLYRDLPEQRRSLPN